MKQDRETGREISFIPCGDAFEKMNGFDVEPAESLSKDGQPEPEETDKK